MNADKFGAEYASCKYWEPLYGARFHEVLNALDLTPNFEVSGLAPRKENK